MRAWRTRSRGIAAGVAAALALTACGGGARQDANEPRGNFQVSVTKASFPTDQKLAQQSTLAIDVRNSGTKTIPDVAVTICNVTCAYPAPAGEGTSSQAFAANINQAYVASASRPVWIVNRPPGSCGGTCQSGGTGGATAYSGTWTLGQLKPGAVASFQWGVTSVQSGKHVVAWEVAAGLNGNAKAVLGNGAKPHGSFTVHVSSAPLQTHVNSKGEIVTQ